MPSPVLDRQAIDKMTKLLAEPRGIDELSEALGVHKRTVFRWLRVIEAEGVCVASLRGDGPGRSRQYKVF